MRRERDDRKQRRVQAASTDAGAEEVRFLPSLPEVQRVARQTWARDTLRQKTPDHLAEVQEVQRLNDVWVGSIIEGWKAPSQEQVCAAAYRAAAAYREADPHLTPPDPT